jgi:hypothetical protein
VETFFRSFGERRAALFFVLGFVSGFPLGYSWFNLSDLLVTRSADAALTGVAFPIVSSYVAISLGVLAAFLIAPFLDRGPAPGLKRWGHRRSWVAAALILALVMAILVFAASLVLAPGAGSPIENVLYVQSILAIPVTAVMMVGVDALRVEVAPGRAQAIVYTSQYLGSLLCAAVLGVLVGSGAVGPKPPLLGLFAVQLAIGLLVLAKLPEPAPAPLPPVGRSALSEAAWFLRPPEYLWRALVQPWVAFFARHGGAAPLLLAAIGFYGLAWSAGQQLTTTALAPTDEAELDRATALLSVLSWLTYVLSPLGAIIGAIVALRASPPRAFTMLQKAIVAFVLLFLVLKLASGATAGGYLVISFLRTPLNSVAFVIFWVVVARLTAMPHTAGQFYLLSTFLALFWLSSQATSAVERALGTIITAGAVCACALGAIACMHLAGRVARQRRPQMEAAPAPTEAR